MTSSEYIFPQDQPALNDLFRKGREPVSSELDGQYEVAILTGIIPNLRWAGHTKKFYSEKGKKTGFNLLLGGLRFGYFGVEKGSCPDFHNLETLDLNYACGQKQNILLSILHDKIRQLASGVYLGRYYLVKNGELDFKGYFSLIKNSLYKKK